MSQRPALFIGSDQHGWRCVQLPDGPHGPAGVEVGDTFEEQASIPCAGMIVDFERMFNHEETFLAIFRVLGDDL
jgi:hypothetical protein